MIQNYSLNKQNLKFSGLVFLRAIFSMIVVALHSNLFNTMSGKGVFSSLTDVLNMNVGYVAVPVFIQISLFLFYLKSKKLGSQYFLQNRLPKLVSLWFFWISSKLLFDALLGDWDSIQRGTSSLIGFLVFIISGGYAIFYFFSCLVFLTIVTEILVSFFNRIDKTSTKIKISYFHYPFHAS